jgi:Na+-translocating ferredoxin:NAD+ oxidoreductase RNF subunit RnfB
MANAVLIAVLLVAGVGLVAGVLLAVASTVFAVPVNEKETAVRDVLPGANCGSCGYSGCDAYAKALANEKDVPANLCRPGGHDALVAISAILGVEVAEADPVAAFVHCGGDCDKCKTKSEYQGIESCGAAKLLYGGPNACTYGCLGCGDCKKACEYDAICIEKGIAHINREQCVACGMCVAACPNHLIEILPKKKIAAMTCSNQEKGAVVRKECTNGCIGCMKCQKSCPCGAIEVTNNLAHIDYTKCSGCGTCVEGCPVGCLKLI